MAQASVFAYFLFCYILMHYLFFQTKLKEPSKGKTHLDITSDSIADELLHCVMVSA